MVAGEKGRARRQESFERTVMTRLSSMSTAKATDGDRTAVHANDVSSSSSSSSSSSDKHRRKNRSILDGTDDVTLMAKARRSSKVVPGMFYESSLLYYGDTAVLWNVDEFMDVKKWREDAMRRSRNNGNVRREGRMEPRGNDASVSSYASAVVVLSGCAVGGRRRRDEDEDEDEDEERRATNRSDGPMGVDGGGGDRPGHEGMPSRRRRFRAMCDGWYRNSLDGGEGMT